MSGSGPTRTITGWRPATRFYRKPPGSGWLLAVIAVPLLLGLIGWSALDHPDSGAALTLPSVDPSATLNAPGANAAAPTPTAAAPNLTFAPLSITRTGNDITLTGDVPDDAAKAAVLEQLRARFGPDVNLIDNLTLKPGVSTPDAAALGSVIAAGATSVPDFAFTLDGDTLTLTGTAPTDDVKAAIETAAKTAWPNLKITNNIQVPAVHPPPPAVAPAPAPGPCAALQGDVSAMLKTPISFTTDGFVLAPDSQQLLNRIADKLKTCPGARVAVTGHTDNSGTDAINVPLSANRAKSVADYLVSQGIAPGQVTSSGVGSADPIAGNDTPDGRAQNRRVEITVS
jgi:peptidoglycan-binding protein ArfA